MSAADHTVAEPAPWQSYRERLADGAIPYQSCNACAGAIFYPRVLCPHCGATDLTWQAAAGSGAVYSQTFLPARDGGGHQVLLVDMLEGFRLMGVSEASDLAIGDTVVGRSEPHAERPDDEPRYVFTKAGE